ncbi:MAG: hypothetical protein IPM54_40070 [Polyangiaceae bacterium]|nr:hypothetical protein [Polyangiaceae bacterium]
MARRKSKRRRSHDIDTILRHTSRRHPTALSRLLLDHDEPIEQIEWIKTQLATRQRRIDRGLRIEMVRGSRILHIEWTLRLNRAIRRRVHEYHHLLAMAHEMDARAKRKRGEPLPKPISIDSVVVVLSGPKKKLPTFGRYRTSSKDQRFSGVRFRIEAIYQRTVAEIEAMGSVFWLAFVPLAMDVDQEKLERVLKSLRAQTEPEDFEDLKATMILLAPLNRDFPGLQEVILSLTEAEEPVLDLLSLHPYYQRAKEQGFAKGRDEALMHLLERRLTRSLTASERKRVSKRLTKHGPDFVGDAILDLSREELAAWLALNGHRSKGRKAK